MDCGRFSVGSLVPPYSSPPLTPSQPRYSARACAPDRFIRPINEAIFKNPKPVETEISTRAQIAYRKALSKALLGVDLVSAPSVFSFPVQRCSPLALNAIQDCSPPAPMLSISTAVCDRVLDVPGIATGRAGLLRPLTVLDERNFVLALANKIYVYNPFTAQNQELSAIVHRNGEGDFEAERTLCHVAVVNPNSGEFVASDSTGRLYHMYTEHVALEEPDGDGDSVVGLAATDRSTLFIGTQTGRILLKDTRDFAHTNAFSVNHRVSVLSLCKDSRLFAVGCENSVRIYDIRRLHDPVAGLTYAGRDEVSALAWGTNLLSKRLLAAFGGENPVITVNDAMGCLQQRCVKKTFGEVTSILPTSTDGFITLRKNSGGKVCVLWECSPTEGLSCTQIGAPFKRGESEVLSSPTSAVLGKNEDFMVTVFSEQEMLTISLLYKGVVKASQKTPDRDFYAYSLR